MAKNNAIDIDIETGGGNTYTFPSATSTLATLDLAETLTNKDLSDASNTLGSANVAAAGALMDSELTSIADVKALNQSVVSGAAPVFDGTNFTNIPTGTVDVVSNVATARILGRTTAGSGDSEELTAAAARTLLNVEDDADKTDTANVEAAGALMDSEVTNLSQVKAFDSTDYAAALGADDNYVTDAEKTVIGNTSGTNTGDQDLSGLAVKANVLELDNTTSFTPDADYEPATKKYVDDTGGGDLWGDLVDADIIPDGDETRDLGSAARQFKKIFTEDININNDIILDSGLYTKFLNNDGNTVFEITTGPSDSYVNYTFVRSADTTQTPSFGVWGDDTNVSLNLTTKGTGKVQANGEEVATVRGAVNAQTGTTYTLVIGDEYLDGVRQTNAAANTITIPPNADVAFPVGSTKIFIIQGGAGSTTIAAGAGVTLSAPASVTAAIGEINGSRVIQKVGVNEWLLV